MHGMICNGWLMVVVVFFPSLEPEVRYLALRRTGYRLRAGDRTYLLVVVKLSQVPTRV